MSGLLRVRRRRGHALAARNSIGRWLHACVCLCCHWWQRACVCVFQGAATFRVFVCIYICVSACGVCVPMPAVAAVSERHRLSVSVEHLCPCQSIRRLRSGVGLLSSAPCRCQVAAKYMPVQSTIIGIDLVAIKPIRNVITHACDITTAECRSLLRKDLGARRADVVLNDGAPNVGAQWNKDAYSQSELVLHALKLATEFLRPGTRPLARGCG